MHLRRPRPTPAVRRPPAPTPPPGLATRSVALDALGLMGVAGDRAADEARTRASAALTRDNLWGHARWRQVERLVRAITRTPDVTELH